MGNNNSEVTGFDVYFQCKYSGKYLVDSGFPSKIKTDILRKAGYSKLLKWVEDIPEIKIFTVRFLLCPF